MALSLVVATLWTTSVAQGQATRESKPKMEGMELYSWQDGLSWRFSLLPGTNRTKSVAEITSRKVTIATVAKLKERLSRLAPGQMVMWLNPGRSPFVYPVPAVTCDLVAFCESLSVKLELGKPCAAA